jgi:site-specific recombinase XerC
MSDETIITGLSSPQPSPSTALSPIARLADIPEEEIWLAKQKSARTRRAYKLDVQHFMRTLHITSYDELRKVDHRAVIAWERIMCEIDEAEPSTIRRRLAALSSLFKHLKRHNHVENNPVAEVERPAINRREGSTRTFSKAGAARLLNTPVEDTIEGLRDRAILSVGLQVGLRRGEIAALSVEISTAGCFSREKLLLWRFPANLMVRTAGFAPANPVQSGGFRDRCVCYFATSA